MLLLLPGCFIQFTQQKAAFKKKVAFSFDALSTCIDVSNASYTNPEIEAKLFDIPTMVGSLTVETEEQALMPGQLMIVSLAPYQKASVKDFYLHEMICLGWFAIADVEGFETVLVFQKPKKLCVINLRPCVTKPAQQYQSMICIMVCPQESLFES